MIWYLLIALLLVCLVVGYQFWAQNSLSSETEVISVPADAPADLPERITVISDLHNHRFGKNNERLLACIDAQAPQLVLIPGDLVIGSGGVYDSAEELLHGLSARGIPTYISLGNHEIGFRAKRPEEYAAFLQRIAAPNVHILDNETCFPSSGYCISGLTLPPECYTKRGRDMALTEEGIAQVVPRPEGRFQILLAHTPYYFPAYCAYGAELTVAGHVHGGIIRLPFVGGVISPQMELFPKHDAGVFQSGSVQMVVSRGLGTHFPPLRVYNRPQVLLLRLDRKER